MKILFVHENYPAQFGQFGGWLRDQHGWDVAFATARKGLTPENTRMRILPFEVHREPTEGVHPYAKDFEKAVIAGQGAARAFVAARDAGFQPDIVMAHSGWGPGIYAKDIWPTAVYVPYFEWYYQYPPKDSVHLRTHNPNLNSKLYQRTRNAPFWADIVEADLGLVPTVFQADQFPAFFRDKLRVIHDGIDVDMHAPDPEARVDIAGIALPEGAEVLTFVTRGMEPHRGFPQFMRAVEALQPLRPNLHVVIGGEDRVAYGDKNKDGEKSWKTKMLDELALDLSRIHFTGLLPRKDYVRLLQATDVHFYASTEFVLSWSMLEAMSVGCLLVASDTAPVREFMTDGETGLLTDFHDVGRIVATLEKALDERDDLTILGRHARARIVNLYAAGKVWTEKKALLESLVGAKALAEQAV
ncbi:MAG: glycosyltransferase [Pseudomonadota bacterium]